jgi:hypothetical protein
VFQSQRRVGADRSLVADPVDAAPREWRRERAIGNQLGKIDVA